MKRGLNNYLTLKNLIIIDLLLLSILMVILGLWGGIPTYMQDSLLPRALKTVENFGSPGYFVSPGFLIYTFAAVYTGIFLFMYVFGFVTSPNDFKMLYEANTLMESPFKLSFEFPGQIIIMLFAMLAVICTYLVAYKLTKKRSISFISSLFILTSLLFIQNAHELTVNVPLVAVVITTVLLVLMFVKEGKPVNRKHLIFLGIALGVTSSTKWTGLLIFFAILAPMMYAYYKLPFQTKYVRFLKDIFKVAFVGAITFLILNPFVILDYKTYDEQTSINIVYVTKHGWHGHESETDTSWIAHLTNSLYNGYGLLPLILAALGLLWVIRTKTVNITTKLAIIVYPAIFYFILGSSKLLIQRHTLPVFPFLAIFSGCGIYVIYLALKTILKSHIKPKKLILVLVPIMIIIFSLFMYPNISNVIKHNVLLTKGDTRLDFSYIINDAGLNESEIYVFCGVYTFWYFKDNPKVLIDNITLREINSSVSDDIADMIVFDSVSHDRIIYSSRVADPHPKKYTDRVVGLKKRYENYDDLYVIQITPFTHPKEEIPFSPQSGITPFPPDIDFRTKSGPFIEIYLKDPYLVQKILGACERQHITCSSLRGRDSYYFKTITKSYDELFPGLNTQSTS